MIKVSAIIPMYNVEDEIERCLKTIINQSHPWMEIIAIDNGSTDRTYEIVKSILDRNSIKSKLIKINHLPTPEGPRNLGFKHSTGDIIFFVESDAYYDRHYIVSCIRHLKNPKIVSVIGNLHSWIDNVTLRRRFYSNYWESIRKIKEKNYKPFSGWFFRREDFESNGMYKEELGCREDREFCKRLTDKGFELAYEPLARWWHKYDNSLRVIWRKKITWGESAYNYKYLHKKFLKESFIGLLFYLVILAKPILIPLAYLGLCAIPVYKLIKSRFNPLKHLIYIFMFPIVSIVTKTAFNLGFIRKWLKL